MSEFPQEKLTHVIDCVTDLHEYQAETEEEEEKSTQKIVLVTGGAGKKAVGNISSSYIIANCSSTYWFYPLSGEIFAEIV